MKKGFVFVCGLIVAVVGCDSEDSAEVGAFSSSLSTEGASIQDLTFIQKDTLCVEFTDYAKDKTLSLEDQYGCLGPIGIAAVESTDTASECAEENKYNNCSVTVAELEACVEEYAVFGYLTLAKGFSASAEVAEEQGAAAASEEAGGMAEGLGDFTEAIGGAIGLGSCEAPEPTPLSGECMVVATACPDLFPDTNLPPSGLPGGDMPGMEGGEEAAAEEGGEEAPAEEGGEEAPAEEGGEA